MLFDTTFLIDLHREVTRRKPSRAFRFLETNPSVPVQISVVTYGGFAEGFGPDEENSCFDRPRPYPVIPLSEAIAWRFGQVSRALHQRGQRIGDNDLWIAATALHHGLDLVARNADEFSRVSGLRVISD